MSANARQLPKALCPAVGRLDRVSLVGAEGIAVLQGETGRPGGVMEQQCWEAVSGTSGDWVPSRPD